MDVGGGDERPLERGGGASSHSWGPSGPDDVEDAEHIGGPELDGDIAGHRGDGLHRDLGRGKGKEHGQGVIDARIGVDEDGRRQLTPRAAVRIIRLGGDQPAKEDRMNILITYCGE